MSRNSMRTQKTLSPTDNSADRSFDKTPRQSEKKVREPRAHTPVKSPTESLTIDSARESARVVGEKELRHRKTTLRSSGSGRDGIHSTSIIIDNGSGLIKAGFAGEDAPLHVFPSIVGRVRKGLIPMMIGTENQTLVGDAAVEKSGILHCERPATHGYVKNWDDMIALWEHTFDKLGIPASTQPVLLTEPSLNPKANREETAKIMFESFDAPSMYMAVDAALSLYAAGRLTGVTCDVGDGVMHTVPIFEGWCLPYGVNRLNVGGRDITTHLQRILNEKARELISSSEFQVVQAIKEECAFVSMDYNSDLEIMDNPELEMTYTLPDGEKLQVGSERFRCAEVIFKPWLVGKESAGVGGLVYDSIKKCDIVLRRALFENIVLSGATTMFPNFSNRLSQEIESLVANKSSDVDVKVIAGTERKYSVWIGGSILASLSTFSDLWVTKGEYHEHGATIVHRKCF